MTGIAASGIATGAAGGVFGAINAIKQGQQQQQAADYNAQVAKNNSQVAAWQQQQQLQESAASSLVTRQQGAAQESQLELKNNQLVARNINSAASSGVTATGSTGDAILGSAYNNDLEVLQTQYKTSLDSWQNEIGASNAAYNSGVQQRNYQGQANLDINEGKNAAASGLFTAAGSILSGASKINEAAGQVNYFQ